MNFYKDLYVLKKKYNLGYLQSAFSNRGFHSLLIYRVSHILYSYKIPIIPLVLTRMIQILYGIDIDYRANIKGGGNYCSWDRNSYR